MNVSSLSRALSYPATARPTSASEAAASGKGPNGTTVLYQSSSSLAPDDPNVTVDTSLVYTAVAVRSPKEQAEFDYTVSLTHRQQPMEQANTALDTIERRLGALQKSIASESPAISNANWDFTIADGKLKVSGSLTDSDKDWLESKLNNDAVLRSAASSYVDAAVSYLETNEENPSYHAMNGFSHTALSYDFKDVKTQFGQVGGFKDILNTLHKRYNDPSNSGILDPGSYRGADSLEYVASLLK